MKGNGSLIFMVEGKPDTISFLKEFNEAVYSNFEGVQTIAEESTSFPIF
jgi:1,4-alpha-glucan branching enzyme